MKDPVWDSLITHQKHVEGRRTQSTSAVDNDNYLIEIETASANEIMVVEDNEDQNRIVSGQNCTITDPESRACSSSSSTTSSSKECGKLGGLSHFMQDNNSYMKKLVKFSFIFKHVHI